MLVTQINLGLILTHGLKISAGKNRDIVLQVLNEIRINSNILFEVILRSK